MQVSHDEQRLVNEKGVELGQVIQKMMIGALQVANIEHFLMKSLEADNQTVREGGNSTEMEHYWDIAWGYLGSINADPDRISPLFLANYIEKEAVGMKGLENINVAVYHAFQAGRKAIVGNRTDEVRNRWRDPWTALQDACSPYHVLSEREFQDPETEEWKRTQ